jgi:hypothetical protein
MACLMRVAEDACMLMPNGIKIMGVISLEAVGDEVQRSRVRIAF